MLSNPDILKPLRCLLPAVLLLLFASSCRQEEPGDSPVPNPPAWKEKGQVTLSINIPGIQTPSTRADANKLGFPISVCAFKVEGGTEKLKFMKVFQSASESGAPSTETIGSQQFLHLRGIDGDDYNRLCILTSTDATGKLTVETSTFSNLQQLEIAGGMDPITGVYTKDAIPMYGELKLATENGISVKIGQVKSFSEEVQFLRSMAYISIRLIDYLHSTSSLKFYFCRSVKNGCVYGDVNTYTTTLNTPASFQANVAQVNGGGFLSPHPELGRYDYIFMGANWYAYEQPAASAMGADGPRLILEYRQDSASPSYFYPIDFIGDDNGHGTKGTPIPIRRNHHYMFTINPPNNIDGYSTLEEALSSKDYYTNKRMIQAELITVDESYKDITFTDNYFLALSQTKFSFRQKQTASSQDNKLTIKSNRDWKITAYDDQGNVIPSGGWLSVNTSSGTMGTTEVSIQTNKKIGFGYLMVEAGNLRRRIDVDQITTPLDCIAEFNLAGGLPYGSSISHGGAATPGQTDNDLRWAIDHERNNSGYYNWYVLNGITHPTYNPSGKNLFDDVFFSPGHPGHGYHLPSRWEWTGVFSYKWQVDINSATNVSNYNKVHEAVQICGMKKTFDSDYGGMGNGICYALRFKPGTDVPNDGSSTSDFPYAHDYKMCCAFRYSIIGAGYSNYFSHLKVDCVYLGEAGASMIIGNFANNAWWNAHASETITRIFPISGYVFPAPCAGSNPRHNFGKEGVFWAGTEKSNTHASSAFITPTSSVRTEYDHLKYHGFSVRLFSE